MREAQLTVSEVVEEVSVSDVVLDVSEVELVPDVVLEVCVSVVLKEVDVHSVVVVATVVLDSMGVLDVSELVDCATTVVV